LTNIITWADSRCYEEAEKLRQRFDEKKMHARTGCMLGASFWPAKLRCLERTHHRKFIENPSHVHAALRPQRREF